MIIQKLLQIESEAQDAMRMMEKEQADLAKKAETELAQRVLELENAKNANLEKLRHSTQEKTLAAIAKIEAEYKQKGSDLVKIFAENRTIWVDKIFNDVLYES